MYEDAPAIGTKALELPQIISDGMVLQRNSEVSLWGKNLPDRSVNVELGWNGEILETESGKDGCWKISFRTPDAGGPYTIVISDHISSIEINDVLIGEVWICAGQSNMAHTLRGGPGQPVEGGVDAILSSGSYRNRIHFLNMAAEGSDTPTEDLPEAHWLASCPASAHTFSATAYFFAVKLTETLGVPVGIISNSWGGSLIESWMDEKTLSTFEEIDVEHFNSLENRLKQQRKCYLYNARMYPIKNYVVKGFLWFQGENNLFRNSPELYGRELKSMVNLWRKDWQKEDMPFYMAQLAPYIWNGCAQTKLPLFVEGQLHAIKDIPFSGMIGLSDLGSEQCIHFPQKRQVGERFAHLALIDCYKVSNALPSSGPFFHSVTFEGNSATVTFENPQAIGLYPENQDISGFEIAAADRVFHPAKARIVKGKLQVVVTSAEVDSPVAVRYAFKNFPGKAGLYNTFGLPAFPFRTDKW